MWPLELNKKNLTKIITVRERRPHKTPLQMEMEELEDG